MARFGDANSIWDLIWKPLVVLSYEVMRSIYTNCLQMVYSTTRVRGCPILHVQQFWSRLAKDTVFFRDC